MSVALAEAGEVSRQVLLLLRASLRGRGPHVPPPPHVELLEFVAETVAGYVEDGEPLPEPEARRLLQDAEMCIDEEDLAALASTIELLTGGRNDEPSDNRGDGDEYEAEEDDGSCELCERFVRRTFHHLVFCWTLCSVFPAVSFSYLVLLYHICGTQVPRVTHDRYLSRGVLPANLERGKCTRQWLSSYGCRVCRPCHSAVHAAAPNAELAEHHNTVARLLELPRVYAFARYNSKQPIRHQPSPALRNGRALAARLGP